DEPFHERQSNAQPSLRARQRSFGLREQTEDARHEVRGDADARIPHLQHSLSPLLLKAQPNMSTFVRVLGSIVEQVHNYLFQTGRIAVYPNEGRGETHGKSVPTLLDQGANGLDATFHDSPHVHLFAV